MQCLCNDISNEKRVLVNTICFTEVGNFFLALLATVGVSGRILGCSYLLNIGSEEVVVTKHILPS